MRVTGWKNSRKGGTLGLRVGKENASRFFDRKWRSVDVDFSGKVVTIDITDSFWAECPELRDPYIKVFLSNFGLAPWPKGRPPRMQLLPCGGNRFRLSLQ
jgi:hypothetical protein